MKRRATVVCGIVCILCILLPDGLAAVSAHRPATAVVRWRIDSRQVSEWSPVELLRLSYVRPGEEPGTAELRLVWRELASGWLPNWGLFVEGDPEFFPGVEPGRAEQNLGSYLLPAAGMEYEFALAYDPATGILSARVENVSTGHVSLRRQLRIGALDEGDAGPELHVRSDSSGPFRLRSASLVPYFVPAGLEARLASWPNEGSAPLIGLDPRDTPEAAVFLRHLPATLTGHYELTYSSGGIEEAASGTTLLWRSEETSAAAAPFRVEALPLDGVTLRLAYVGPDGKRWPLAQYEVLRQLSVRDLAPVPWSDPTLDRPIRTLTFELGPPRRAWRTSDAFAGWELSPIDPLRQSALLVAFREGFTPGLVASGLEWEPNTEYHFRVESIPLDPVLLKAELVSARCPGVEEVRRLEPVQGPGGPVRWMTFALSTGDCDDYELRLSVGPPDDSHEAPWSELLLESVVVARAGAAWGFRNFDEKDRWITLTGERASVVPRGAPGTGIYAGRVEGGGPHATLTNPTLPILPDSTYRLSFRFRNLALATHGLNVRVESPAERAQGSPPRLDATLLARVLWDAATLEFETGPFEDYRLVFERPGQSGEVVVDEIRLVRKEE